MKKYLSILRVGWLDAVEYRTEFFVSVLGWGIRIFLAVFLWLAVASSKGGSIGDYSFNKIMGYFFIIQIISSFVFSRISFDIALDIYRGDFANYMLKPMNYLVFRLVREMSKNAFRTLMGIVIFGSVMFIFFGGIPLPAWKIPLALLVIIGAYLVNFCIVAMIAMSAFWVTSATRFAFIYFGILTIFSGILIPVDLFPPKLFEILFYLPFGYIFYFPAKIIQAPEMTGILWQGLAFQWGYFLALIILVTIQFKLGVKKFEAVGR